MEILLFVQSLQQRASWFLVGVLVDPIPPAVVSPFDPYRILEVYKLGFVAIVVVVVSLVGFCT